MEKLSLIIFAVFATIPIAALARVNVVASTSDLAYFTREIGGDLVEVNYIAPPNADIHFIEARPSYMVKVARAEIVFKVGLELDMWMDNIIDGSRNGHLRIFDCSKYIQRLEVPTFKADARHGDLHRFGNPHYWLGPQNAEPISQAIVEGLVAVDPEHESQYRQNETEFLGSLKAGLDSLQSQFDFLKGQPVVYYHDSWPYFDEFTGLEAAAFIEPYPGVAPTPSHIKELVDLINSRKIKVIAVEPYFDRRVPDKIASLTGATVVTIYPSIGGRQKDDDYLLWLKGNLDSLTGALR